MTLRTIFEKPVDRTIEGVIKADDENGLRTELDEYVLTNEIAKRLEAFLDAYNHYKVANGVWISGFFGSGKSHLLKMLALLLENRTVDNSSALDFFLTKCGDNEILRGQLKKAASIPSKSILFNIDQKADVISKKQIDALLAVFVKVFDEMCGYYGKLSYIAQFERDLDSRDLFVQFKEHYQAAAKRPWEQGREQAILETTNIAKAYSKIMDISESDARGILEKYRSEYRLSIEDFANQVQAYLDKKPANFRLNFFVDEVGQYIADNVKLMTNLQTIAESLATKCRGRAWVIVTAQEEMDNVLGEMNRQQSNDFSKIQARFANRMQLTSQDVDEVIQKRLLKKNEVGVNALIDIYDAEYNNFKTLFDFSDGSVTFRNFQDRDHFVRSYPFIPYQFGLFQSVIRNLSARGMFVGKNSSVGERSMLGVFQEVAKAIGDSEVGEIATFDLMFEGIRTVLKASVQAAVLQAEKNLENKMALRVLKALFLVKYEAQFKATLRNLCVLMHDSFERDVSKLRKEIEQALALLEQQTYIQRTGEIFEFLTDDEKDIEQEIKNTDVDQGDVADHLEKLIFDAVLKQRKIRYDANGQDYSFARKLDDKLHGRDYELSIHVISPFFTRSSEEQAIIQASWGKPELLVIMPADDVLIRDLLMLKKTDKYVRHNESSVHNEVKKRIFSDKKQQNRDREINLQDRVKNLLGRSKLVVNGSVLDVSIEDAQSRVFRGANELVSKTYTNLRMLSGVSFSEDRLASCLRQPQDTILEHDTNQMSEAEREMLSFISRNNNTGIRTTVKNLVEAFEKKPYGWYQWATLCTFAQLFARGKLEVRKSKSSEILECETLERDLRNSSSYTELYIDPQIEFTGTEIRVLKDFIGEFFSAPAKANEAKGLAKEAEVGLKNLLTKIQEWLKDSGQFPFVTTLEPARHTLQGLLGKPCEWDVREFPKYHESLFEFKENIIDPIEKFMNGPQRTIFESARSFLVLHKVNLEYINESNYKDIRDAIQDPSCFRGNRVQQLKSSVEALEKCIKDIVAEEIQRSVAGVRSLENRLVGMPEFEELSAAQKEKVRLEFKNACEGISGENLIPVIRDRFRQFEDKRYGTLLAEVSAWATPQTPSQPNNSAPSARPQEVTSKPAATSSAPVCEMVSSKNLSVEFDKAWLADESDVDRYLKSFRDVLLKQIRNGKKVQI